MGSLARPAGALIALLLAVAPAAAQTPVKASNGYDVSTGAISAPAADLGLNRAVADGERRRGTADNSVSAQTTPPRVLQPQSEYAKYPVYTGMLGEVPIHMRLGAKPGEIDSVHGEYLAGKGPGVRLVTGEYENGGFLMEESDDGTHVTGTWEGAVDARGVVRGTWTEWGGANSLALPYSIPSMRTATAWPPADWENAGGLVRLYIGLEDPRDLIADLKQAMEAHLRA
ncbi:hypothetical protein GRD98_06110 [Ralstonia solanacearum]|nr:hypothetical protein GRD98_06110 [Ralstonia solanacearum]